MCDVFCSSVNIRVWVELQADYNSEKDQSLAAKLRNLKDSGVISQETL